MCGLDNVDESTYQTSHSFSCCDNATCLAASSDLWDSVSGIVAGGGIPIVHFDSAKLEVVAFSEEGAGFTAISHVWSGGPGNAQSNTLSNCQLNELQRNVNGLMHIETSADAEDHLELRLYPDIRDNKQGGSQPLGESSSSELPLIPE